LPSKVQNFFVYGGFTPFVGAGHDLGGWSVIIALDKPKEDFGLPSEIRPFEVSEVYSSIDAGLSRLCIPDIQATDCFFARGTDLRGNPNFLPNIFGRPVKYLDPQAAARYLFQDDETVRHYRCYRVVDWGGELALSYYLRCSLFVETKRFILTPIDDLYRNVDRLVPREWGERVATGFASLIVGPWHVALSPLWAFAEVMRIFKENFGSEIALEPWPTDTAVALTSPTIPWLTD
jgi:hypothetical protein